MKRCTGCREVKPTEGFHASGNKDGLAIYCKDCRREQARRTHLRRTYGLDEAGLRDMIEAQYGVCAVCQERPAAHVDHDHRTGQIRGVLCFSCNVAIGHFRDDPELMRKAIQYLERSGTFKCQRTMVAAGVYQLTSVRPATAALPRFSLPPRPTSFPPV